MHRAFQLDLGRLRLTTARAYVKTIEQSNTIGSGKTGNQVRIGAEVIGLGPSFKVKLDILNEGGSIMFNVCTYISCDLKLYEICSPSFISLAALLPGVPAKLEISILSIDPNGTSGDIRVLIIDNHNRKEAKKFNGNRPLVSATIKMPRSELQ